MGVHRDIKAPAGKARCSAGSILVVKRGDDRYEGTSWIAKEPRKSVRQQGLLNNGVQYVIDCDISSFFDNLRHDVLLSLLRKRVKDGRLLELIAMWLEAGIMDGKDLVFPEKRSPQGSVISPLLANVYLHEVLDVWFAEVVMPRCRGRGQEHKLKELAKCG